MIINFHESTYEKLRFLADREGRSVAAFVSMRMDELTGQLVNTTFSINELGSGTPLSYLDPTPRPAPDRGEQSFHILPSDSARNQERRYAEEQY